MTTAITRENEEPMKKMLLAGVVSIAWVAPAWANPPIKPCDPLGSCPGNSTSTSSASAVSHATAGAAATVTNTNRNDLTNTNTNRVVVRNVINTGGAGASPPLTVAAPIVPAAAAPVAPATPAATAPADPPADPATHPQTGHGGHGGGGNVTNYYSGNSGDYHEPVATAYAPSFGTVNPCVGTSASLGAQFQLFGLSAGGQNMDEECRMLRLGTQADVIAARNLICLQSSDARTAYYEAGLPCPADRAKFAAEQHPAVVQPVSAVVAAPPHKAPAWCAHASKHPTEASAAYIAQECGG
jgi:hypothetical protein